MTNRNLEFLDYISDLLVVLLSTFLKKKLTYSTTLDQLTLGQ